MPWVINAQGINCVMDMDLNTLIENGVIDSCKYVEVLQVILLVKNEKCCWNYFTHITFDNSHDAIADRQYLTDGPQSINGNIKVIISREVASKEDILTVLENAAENHLWKWKSDEAQLDDIFPIDPQFIPETDPTGSKTTDSTLVPIEQALYGSNFMGGYYLCELFSAKNTLSKLLTCKDIASIQNEIRKAKLGYDLERLTDRIGNVVCKIPMKQVKHNPIKLGPDRGIEGNLVLLDNSLRNIKLQLQIIAENDNTIVESHIYEVKLSDIGKESHYSIESNRYKNTIILSDAASGIIYYAAIRDYSFGSNYNAIITPPKFGFQSMQPRRIIVDDQEVDIELTNLGGVGDICIEKEIFEMEKRQHKWLNEYEHEHYFFRSFVAGQENEAIKTVISICNDKDLFWDLKEIWLVDPYLSAEDILRTVVHCGKFNINIKCLTHISTINSSPETRIDGENNQTRSEATFCKFKETLRKGLEKQNDLKLEFRTVAGIPFHDRYLILKYGINKSRAWALGISVNSLGKSHHIIQIVESPEEVIKTLDYMWEQSSGEEFLIFKN